MPSKLRCQICGVESTEDPEWDEDGLRLVFPMFWESTGHDECVICQVGRATAMRDAKEKFDRDNHGVRRGTVMTAEETRRVAISQHGG